MFYIEHEKTNDLANDDCTGEHDVKPTQIMHDAKSFETRAEAYDFWQNFGPDWNIVEY